MHPGFQSAEAKRARENAGSPSPSVPLRTVGIVGGVAVSLFVIRSAWRLLRASLFRGEASAVKEECKGQLVDLLPKESSELINEFEATTTITFYKGEKIEEAIKFLEERVRDIVKANPWLAGRLVKKNGMYMLEIPEDDNSSSSRSFAVLDREAVKLSQKTHYPDIHRIISVAKVKKGCETVDTDEPLFKVSVVRDEVSPDDSFALVVSLSHTLGDGHTFYSVYKMLSQGSDTKVTKLNAERKQWFTAAEEKSFGKAETGFWFQSSWIPSFMLAQLRMTLTGYRCETGAFYINEEWVAAEKKRWKAKLESENKSANNNNDTKAGKKPAQFVSTNDVVTSWWFNLYGNSLAGMAINCRSRVEGCLDSDAGNYEHFMVYRRRDYATPALIRQSVQNLRRSADPPTPLPSFSELLLNGSTMTIISNWASFYGDVELDGCTQQLHLPVYDYEGETMPGQALVVLFRPRAGELALMFAAPTGSMEKIKLQDAVGSPLPINLHN
uniref:Uncharacterized protein n=1 Tax=Lotharella globosa TaxID=91324 RepID=A0A7S4DXL6_9EUKA|mmetsp:Transcript_27472/g.53506  ORF Transcript_27472/g.53506 Transcript_27472/m.53506 type:complete len:498 (+) Transcript_27472:31-1524(+)